MQFNIVCRFIVCCYIDKVNCSNGSLFNNAASVGCVGDTSPAVFGDPSSTVGGD